MTVEPFTYGLTRLYDTPYFSGGGVSTLVPGRYPVALAGMPFMLDTNPENFQARWHHETIPLLRQQADQSSSPAESSLNPQAPWRRAQDSWHHGAGQTWRDRDAVEPDKFRFRASKGIDPWNQYELTLLNQATQARVSVNTNLAAVVAGSRLYLADGTALVYTTDLSAFTTVTGTPGTTITSLASDGRNVYFTDGTNIYTTNTSTSAATLADTTDADLLRFVKGRLMVAKANVLYNIAQLGSTTGMMTFTHPNAGWTWVDACAGSANIFVAGYAGDKSYIYRTAIKADGTALDVPIQCGELPDGEIVRSLQGYLGFVIIGTDLGWRFCEVDGQGNLSVGPVVETGAPVYCFEPQERFVWFGWSDYDASSTGLGRMDLTAFVATDQPAYASDLMVATSGTVSSVVTFDQLRVFTVQGSGLWAEQADTPVASGTMDSGSITFGIPDVKTALSVDVACESLGVGASYGVYLTVDGTTTTQLGADDTTDGSTGGSFSASQRLAGRYEVRLTLAASGSVAPSIHRWTLKALPAPQDGPAEVLHLPLLLHSTVDLRGVSERIDVSDVVARISALRESREIVTLQYFSDTYTGFVSDFDNFPYGLRELEGDGAWTYDSTCLVSFQRIT